MLIFLYGADTFRSRAHLHQMIEKFKKDRDPQGLNVVRLDCEKIEAGKILEQIMAAPFLAERRMVVLENLLVTSKHKEFMDELRTKIEENNIPESNVLIFWEATDKFKTKAAKSLSTRLQKEKFSQQFEQLKGVKLGSWINAEVKKRDGQFANDATRYITEHAGEDSWRIHSLIDQLISYRDGNEVGLKDVQLFLDEKVDDNIFNLVDAIVAGQEKVVYKMIQEQYRKGEDVQYMFAMILRQFRILLELRDVFERDDTLQSNVLAQRLGLHPFVVKKSLPLVRRYTMDQLRGVYERLLQLDIGIKTGQGDPELLLDVFVGRVANTASRS